MILNINSALVGIGYGLLVLFFAIGVFSSAASFRELQRPEFALRHFIRLVLAKVAVGRGMELMTAIFSICGSVVSASMNGIGGAVETAASLPVEIVNAIEGVSFLQGIPLWLVSFLGSLFITVMSFILILTVYGRFFKLYLYTAISPLPFASFAGENTAGIGKAFVKSYMGVCLEGAVIVLAWRPSRTGSLKTASAVSLPGCFWTRCICISSTTTPRRSFTGPGSVFASTATGALLFAGATAGGAALWMELLYRAFSYDGKRQMSKQIIEGIAGYVKLPEGGVGLDVGCGSGALTIACSKRNPQGRFIGIDRWGKEYASYNKPLCEANAKAEGVGNTEFRQGDALKLDFPDESFDAVVSNYVYHNILGRDRQEILLETLRVLKKGGTFALHDIFSKAKYGDMQAFVQKLRTMGYQQVELIDTTNGMFMSPWEAKWMALSDSALLVGKK